MDVGEVVVHKYRGEVDGEVEIDDPFGLAFSAMSRTVSVLDHFVALRCLEVDAGAVELDCRVDQGLRAKDKSPVKRV